MPETFPLCQKAPSVRGLSPLGDWGSVTQNIPASVLFSSVPVSQGFAAHSFRHGCAMPPPSRREALVRAGNFPSLSKGSLREGAVAARRLGECYPKYSCISAFFISSSFSRLCGSLLPSRLRHATSLKEGGFSAGRKLSLFVKRLPP